MATTREDIRGWLKEGRREKATHVVIVCDTFDYEDYPVNVKKGEDVRAVVAKYSGPNMQKVMEVYSLTSKHTIEAQLKQAGRVFNYD